MHGGMIMVGFTEALAANLPDYCILWVILEGIYGSDVIDVS